jgi:hypothetical protein
MFDPTVGRLFQEDKTGFEPKDANLYRYVRNSPTSATDPTGLEPLPVAPRPRPAGTQPLNYTTGPVLAGHGEWFPEHGYIVVPNGTTITFFVPAGEDLGNIDEKDDLLKKSPRFWVDRKRPNDFPADKIWYYHRPSGRLIDTRDRAAMTVNGQKDGANYWFETFYPGEVIPNYTLFSAKGGVAALKLGEEKVPIETPKVAVAGTTATTVQVPTQLSTLLRAYPGDVWWSACRQHNPPRIKKDK